jgi:hypothetical protein
MITQTFLLFQEVSFILDTGSDYWRIIPYSPEGQVSCQRYYYKYDMEILEGLTAFSSGPIVTFLEDIEGEKPYVSINNFSVHHWHPN